MNSTYISKKVIIISAIIGLLMPFTIGIGLADSSPLPNFISMLLWGIPGSIANVFVGFEGVGTSALGRILFFATSAVYYAVIISAIRAICIAIKNR